MSRSGFFFSTILMCACVLLSRGKADAFESPEWYTDAMDGVTNLQSYLEFASTLANASGALASNDRFDRYSVDVNEKVLVEFTYGILIGSVNSLINQVVASDGDRSLIGHVEHRVDSVLGGYPIAVKASRDEEIWLTLLLAHFAAVLSEDQLAQCVGRRLNSLPDGHGLPLYVVLQELGNPKKVEGLDERVRQTRLSERQEKRLRRIFSLTRKTFQEFHAKPGNQEQGEGG